MKQKNEVKAVIFDMDGVIIDNNDWHLKAWMEYSRKLGMPLTEEEFPTRVFGKTNEEILIEAFPDADPDQILSWSLEKEALYREMYRPHFQLAPGLFEFLEQVKSAGLPMAVASNAPRVNVDFALDEGKIRDYFETYLYYGVVARPKPAPDIYLESCRRLGLDPSNCWVIEDSPTGIHAAVQAGCVAIAIASTFPADDLLRLTPHVFPNFNEISIEFKRVLE
jgi:beta-phosphoglucomutase